MPLNRSELAALVSTDEVQSLTTTQAWANFYNRLARRMKPSYTTPLSMYTDLCTVVDIAIDLKKKALRFSDDRLIRTFNSANWAAVPFVKPGTTAYNTARYVQVVIKEFGLAEKSDVRELYTKACSKAGLVTNSSEFLEKLFKTVSKDQRSEARKELWKDPDIQEALMNELIADFGEDTALSMVEQFAHFKPIIGQIYHYVRGAQTSLSQTKKAMEFTAETAKSFMKNVLCTVAVAENSPAPSRALGMYRAQTAAEGGLAEKAVAYVRENPLEVGAVVATVGFLAYQFFKKGNDRR